MHSDDHCVNGSMFDHPNTKTYEMLIGLESDKRLLEEQRVGEGHEIDDENLDEYDENELDGETDHLMYEKDHETYIERSSLSFNATAATRRQRTVPTSKRKGPQPKLEP